MATVRAGGNGALIIIDAQVGVLGEAWNPEDVINNIAVAVERARAERAPVIWIRHDDDELVAESSQWQLVPQLTIGSSDHVVHKHHNSSFEGTELDVVLGELGISHLALAGAATNWCVRATAYAALERGYDVTVVGDAHTTEALMLSDGTVIDPLTVIADLNTTVRWLDYPERNTAVVNAADLRFDV